MSTLPLIVRYLTFEFATLGPGNISSFGERWSLLITKKLMVCAFKVGETGFAWGSLRRVQVWCRGLETSLLSAQVFLYFLLFSLISRDQEIRHVTSRSVSCFRVGVRICEDTFGKPLCCPGLEKEFLAPRTLGYGCSRVSGMCVLFSLLPLLTVQPPSRLSGGRLFLRAPGSESSRAHT